MNSENLARQLREEADKHTQAAERLRNAADLLMNNGKTKRPYKRRTGARKMSAAARKRISEAQKARWAAQKGRPRKTKARRAASPTVPVERRPS